MNFNKERFANFAKYDLTINKTFFRNLVFVSLRGLCTDKGIKAIDEMLKL